METIIANGKAPRVSPKREKRGVQKKAKRHWGGGGEK